MTPMHQMKRSPHCIPFRQIVIAALGFYSLLGSLRATDGTWSNAAGGVWGTAGNWLGNQVASGTGSTANFANLNIGSSLTVSLNGDRTVGYLNFGDTNISTPGGWQVSAGSPGTSKLILDAGGPTPTITVSLASGQTAQINAAITATSGFKKLGTGALSLVSGSNSISSIELAAGTILATGTAALGGANLITVSGANTHLVITGGTTPSVSSALVLNTSSSVRFDDAVTITGPISGSGGITFGNANGGSGGSTTTVGGDNTSFAGVMTVTAGTLILDNNNAAGLTGVVNVSSNATLTISSGVTLNAGNQIHLAGGSLNKTLGAGSNLAGAINSTSQLSGSSPDTSASLLAGLTSGSTTLQSSFSNTSTASNDSARLSNVYTFTGTGTDIFALQLSMTSVAAGSMLGWLNSGGQWVNSVFGNTGNNASVAQQGYAGSFASFQGVYGTTLSNYLGAYGSDSTGVWAVINHNSDFAVIPEPSTYALLAFAAGTFLLFRRRKV